MQEVMNKVSKPKGTRKETRTRTINLRKKRHLPKGWVFSQQKTMQRMLDDKQEIITDQVTKLSDNVKAVSESNDDVKKSVADNEEQIFKIKEDHTLPNDLL